MNGSIILIPLKIKMKNQSLHVNKKWSNILWSIVARKGGKTDTMSIHNSCHVSMKEDSLMQDFGFL